MSYCDLGEGFSESGSVTWGPGNIDADPLFADAANGDFHLKSAGGRWLPSSGTWVIDAETSPCIDAGDPASDYSNETAPNGGRINMGAYGNTAEASRSLQVAAPEFSPAPGAYPMPVDVTISCPTAEATIRYTTNGVDPTSSTGTVYSAPVHLTATTTLKAIAFKTGMADSALASGLYTKDSTGPAVSGVATVPTEIRQGTDLSLALTASASDVSTGGLNVVAAEYFIGADPGVGSGTPMQPGDGGFDSATEGLVATVNTASWTAPGVRRLNIRARDAAGNWTVPVSHIDVSVVPVVDGTPPSPPAGLSGEPGPGFSRIAVQAWHTLGTLESTEEALVIDLGEARSVAAVGMRVDLPPLCFPINFSIESSESSLADWTPVGKAASFGRRAGTYLWQCDPSEYRYVRTQGLESQR